MPDSGQPSQPLGGAPVAADKLLTAAALAAGRIDLAKG
jgi:hypothetical protein